MSREWIFSWRLPASVPSLWTLRTCAEAGTNSRISGEKYLYSLDGQEIGISWTGSHQIDFTPHG